MIQTLVDEIGMTIQIILYASKAIVISMIDSDIDLLILFDVKRRTLAQ